MGPDMSTPEQAAFLQEVFARDNRVSDVLERFGRSEWSSSEFNGARAAAEARIEELFLEKLETGFYDKPEDANTSLPVVNVVDSIKRSELISFALAEMDLVSANQAGISEAMGRPGNTLAELENLYAEQRELMGWQRALRKVLEHFGANKVIKHGDSRDGVVNGSNDRSVDPFR